MKLNDLKHNHSLTDLLKVFIFSILMLVPFLSVATRCLYVICNKNAYQNYTGNQEEQITTNENYNQMQFNKTYDLVFNTGDQWTGELKIVGTYIEYTWNNGNIETLTGYDRMYLTSPRDVTFLSSSGSTTIYRNTNSVVQIKFTFISYQETNFSGLVGQFHRTYRNPITNLDNVFEYSIDKLADSQYYNWTQNTAIYTGIQTMTTQLGITGATIPILLTYWFMLTIIYVVIDIIIKIFTTLTHMLGNKTAK